MNTDMVMPEPAPGSLVLSRMEIGELRAEFARSLKMTANNLQHLASVWRELEMRGEDLSDLRTGLWSYMPLIAAGTLKPELVVKYAGRLMLLRKLAALPIPDQDRLLRDDRVDVLQQEGDRWVDRKMPITQIATPMLGIVVRDRIMTLDEQRLALGGRELKTATPTGRGASGRAVAAAHKRRGRTKSRSYRGMSLSLTDAEWAALQRWAADGGVSVAGLVAGSLAAAGLLA